MQKSVLKLIMKGEYQSYSDACQTYKLQKLYEHREKLCLTFTKKEFKKPNYGIFHKATFKSQRLAKKIKVYEPKCRTDRFYKSSIPYLSRLRPIVNLIT